MEEIEIRINELIALYDFDALTVADQEMVLTHLSKEAYEARRMVVIESSAMFQDEAAMIAPDPNLLFSLREAQRRSAPRRGLIAAVLLFRIPAYQVGIAAALLLFWFFGRTTPPLEQPQPQVAEVIYETVHDTIEVVKEVLVEMPVERIVKVVEYADPPLLAAVALTDEQLAQGITPPAAVPELDDVQRSFGNSSVDQESLEQFRVVGL